MYVSANQVERSLIFLEELHPFFGTSFLAFKSFRLPVGTPIHVVFSRIVQKILLSYYSFPKLYEGFYSPFKTSDKARRWNSPRYGSTSLQRITTDTFRPAFVHTKGSSEWAWDEDYLPFLKEKLEGKKIPVFHLAVWCFRNRRLPSALSPEELRDQFLREFFFTKEEIDELCDLSIDKVQDWLAPSSITTDEILDFISTPPGFKPEPGALESLYLRNVGASKSLEYNPADRLNLITGDNSLGKTFLLDIVWWTLSGHWPAKIALPKEDAPKSSPRITYRFKGAGSKRGAGFKDVTFNWEGFEWSRKGEKVSTFDGVGIYCRYDGSCLVWDVNRKAEDRLIRFPTKKEIWEGLEERSSGRRLCNGLIRDLVDWTTRRDFEAYSDLFSQIIRRLSSKDSSLSLGRPKRVSMEDSREFPSLRQPYGEVLLPHVSAGIDRVVTLAYILVWVWQEHVKLAELKKKPPSRLMLFLLDEAEAHLHPQWQRSIVPGLLGCLACLSESIKPQLHIATHSPLVCASIEPLFDAEQDALHHLRLEEVGPVLEILDFYRKGRVDKWLESEVFELRHPRSIPASDAIEEAKSLQRRAAPSPEAVRSVHEKLRRSLPDDDDFWHRWHSFASSHGVKE